MFNLSIELRVPQMWKLANLHSFPEVSPLTECNRLRPILLTDFTIRLFERAVHKQEIALHLKKKSLNM